MKLAEGLNEPLVVCDIETLAEMVDIGCYDPDKGLWIEFEISRRKNDTYRFVQFYTSHQYRFLVGFNSVSFDQPILQYIVKNCEGWYDLTGEEIAKLVYRYVQRHIDDLKYGLRPKFTEDDFSIAPIDVFKIHHFDNEAKMTSLKWCEFMMNMQVEEMPIEHWRKNLTDEEMDTVIAYRRHDVLATLGMLYITIGQPDKVEELNGGIPVDHLSDYRGMNMIQDRLDVRKETGLSCMNWSDVKIGEEWNKLDYMKAMNIEDERELYPDKVSQPFGKKFKKYFPKTMKFKTHQLGAFIKKLGEQPVLAEKQEFPITLGETTYTIAKGGIHSTEKNRKLLPPPGWKLRDADVGSQYPNSIVKLKVCPPHLEVETMLGLFVGKIERRIQYKTEAKRLAGVDDVLARLRMSVQGLLKLCMNGGYYGKLGQKGAFLNHPEGLLQVCMGNQIEILMAIEMMELAGFRVLSGNTDGFVTLFPADKEELYKQLCREWEELVGNDKLGKLEYVDYIGLWQRNINNYIGHYLDDKGKKKVKKKGSFVTSYGAPGCGMNKNKSKRIIPLALEQYFIHGTDPIQFIRNHDRIQDFTIAVKASGKMHYEEEWIEEGRVQTKKHKKLVVYYITTEGTVLMKRGFNHEGKPMNNHCEAEDPKALVLGQPLVKYFNTPYVLEDIRDYRINYNYYIYETLKIIDDIEKTRKASRFLDSLKPAKQVALAFDF
jgi:hypothetical protein